VYTSHPNTHRHIITAEEGYVCVYMYAAGSVCVLHMYALEVLNTDLKCTHY
jgi:hypothetical protein